MLQLRMAGAGRQALAGSDVACYPDRMTRFLLIFSLLWPGPLMAQDWLPRLVVRTEAAFPGVPPVTLTADLRAVCGGEFEGQGAYCPSETRVVLPENIGDNPQGPYILAHLYGHALQVTYGVADVALAAIQSDRAREAELRGMVTRQVECLAGVLLARAGLPRPDLAELYEEEPMTGAHWGRNPVRLGPRVSIGLRARQNWLDAGYAAADPSECTLGDMAADLIAENDLG